MAYDCFQSPDGIIPSHSLAREQRRNGLTSTDIMIDLIKELNMLAGNITV